MIERATRRVGISAGLLGLAAALASSAAAQEPPPQPWRLQMERAERPPMVTADEPERRWYGWQTLTIDLACVATVLVAGANDSAALGWTGAGTWLIGAPIVHLANERGATAAISLGIRAGAVLLFVGGGALVLPVFDDSADASGEAAAVGMFMVLIGLAGLAAAVTIDAAMLAFEEKPAGEQALRIVPWFDPERGRAGARLSLSL